MTINWTKSWRNLGSYRYYNDSIEICLDKKESNEWELVLFDYDKNETMIRGTWEKKKYAISALIEFIQSNY